MGPDEIEHQIINLKEYKRDLSNDIHDKNWEPNNQIKENNLPKPNLRKTPKPQNNMQPLESFLERIDEPEIYSNSIQFNITPVKKIQLTKRGHRYTGPPPISTDRQRDTDYPLSLGADSPSNRSEPLPPHDESFKTEPLMTDNDDLEDDRDNDSQIITIYSREYEESVSDLTESEFELNYAQTLIEPKSESEMESEYGETCWIQVDNKTKVETWLKSEFWGPMAREDWITLKSEHNDMEIKLEPTDDLDNTAEIPNLPTNSSTSPETTEPYNPTDYLNPETEENSPCPAEAWDSWESRASSSIEVGSTSHQSNLGPEEGSPCPEDIRKALDSSSDDGGISQ